MSEKIAITFGAPVHLALDPVTLLAHPAHEEPLAVPVDGEHPPGGAVVHVHQTEQDLPLPVLGGHHCRPRPLR